jgi:hypothetical protein
MKGLFFLCIFALFPTLVQSCNGCLCSKASSIVYRYHSEPSSVDLVLEQPVPEITLPPSVDLVLEQPVPEITQPRGMIITSGNRATLTRYNDIVMQCGTYVQGELIAAVNPLLLGITEREWLDFYANADPSNVPWCNRQMVLTIRNVEYTFTIGDTCDPVGPTPTTPFAGKKCDYTDVIDIWNGEEFLTTLFGDDFYQGEVEWRIL